MSWILPRYYHSFFIIAEIVQDSDQGYNPDLVRYIKETNLYGLGRVVDGNGPLEEMTGLELMDLLLSPNRGVNSTNSSVCLAVNP